VLLWKRELRLSVVSRGSEWSERGWRKSTISALESIGFEGEDRGGRNGNRESVMISGPVEGSFKQVDGAFVWGARTGSSHL
jgi:hypothetical protein